MPQGNFQFSCRHFDVGAKTRKMKLIVAKRNLKKKEMKVGKNAEINGPFVVASFANNTNLSRIAPRCLRKTVLNNIDLEEAGMDITGTPFHRMPFCTFGFDLR